MNSKERQVFDLKEIKKAGKGLERIGHSAGLWLNEDTGETFIDVTQVATELAGPVENIPRYINDERAAEIRYLANTFLGKK